jgi:hypothetical protein
MNDLLATTTTPTPTVRDAEQTFRGAARDRLPGG